MNQTILSLCLVLLTSGLFAQSKTYTNEGIKKITFVDSGAEAKWHFGDRNFVLSVPDADLDEISTVFRIELN